MSNVDGPSVEVRESLTERQFGQLMALFGEAWWTRERSADDVRRMLANSRVVALVRTADDALVGFARVLADDVYVALVLDVIVPADLRGTGLGALLMDAVVRHPGVTGVRSVELVCQPDLMPFYRRWGFTEQVGASRLMRRTSDPLLTGSPARAPGSTGRS